MKMVLTQEELDIRFTYHPPDGPEEIEKYRLLRTDAALLARRILELCPHSREQKIAIGKLEEVVMFANAAIARQKKRNPPS